MPPSNSEVSLSVGGFMRTIKKHPIQGIPCFFASFCGFPWLSGGINRNKRSWVLEIDLASRWELKAPKTAIANRCNFLSQTPPSPAKLQWLLLTLGPLLEPILSSSGRLRP